MRFYSSLSRQLLPFLYLLHMLAVLWWTVPQHFASLKQEASFNDSPIFALEFPLLEAAYLPEGQLLRRLLDQYIDSTGSQQYWDFFAPATPKFHQYLSLCAQPVEQVRLGKITCADTPLFSNYQPHFRGFGWWQPDESRLYRLTENLSNLNDPALLAAFVSYYQQQAGATDQSAYLVLHQFEISPGLKGLDSMGYPMHSILFASHP